MIEYIKKEERFDYLLKNVKPISKLELEKILMDKELKVSEDFFIKCLGSVHPSIWVTAALERFNKEKVKHMIQMNIAPRFLKLYYYVYKELDLISDADVTISDIEQWFELLEPRDWTLNMSSYFHKGNIAIVNQYKGNNIILKYIKQSLTEPIDTLDLWDELVAEIFERYNNNALFIIKMLLYIFDRCGIEVPEHWKKEYLN